MDKGKLKKHAYIRIPSALKEAEAEDDIFEQMCQSIHADFSKRFDRGIKIFGTAWLAWAVLMF